jgi:hypothetical protein
MSKTNKKEQKINEPVEVTQRPLQHIPEQFLAILLLFETHEYIFLTTPSFIHKARM